MNTGRETRTPPPALPAPQVAAVPGGALDDDPTAEEEAARQVEPASARVVWRDPVAELNPAADAAPWRARLRMRPRSPWSAATCLRLVAPSRWAPLDEGRLVSDESPCVLVAYRLPVASLNPVQRPVPMLDRLRELHTRVIELPTAYPLAAEWSSLAGSPAVLDRFARRPGRPAAAFTLSRAVSDGLGVYLAGWGPQARSGPLLGAGRALANELTLLDADTVMWRRPAHWNASEQLLLTTDLLTATATLRDLLPGQDVDGWRSHVFDQFGFMRTARTIVDRPMRMRGVDDARLEAVEWQPMMSGRRLTFVVTGVAGTQGFSLIHHISAGPTAEPPGFDVFLDAVEVHRSSG